MPRTEESPSGDQSGRHAALRWTERSRTTAFESPIFQLHMSERESAGGLHGTFVLVDSPDWATVIPVLRGEDEADTFVLVRQYRHGCDCVTLEFPGGIIDRGEAPAAAAARELEEETGFTADEVIEIGTINPNPSFMTNRCHVFLASNVRKVNAQSLDELEVIDVETVPIADVLAGRVPEFDRHAIMLTAIEFYRRHISP